LRFFNKVVYEFFPVAFNAIDKLTFGTWWHLMRGNVVMLPFPDNIFDSLVSSFTLSGIPDGERALSEMVRVTALEDQVVLVDIGLSEDRSLLGKNLALLWQSMGDNLYDQPTLMTNAGLVDTYFDGYGPGDNLRAIVGQKPGS
jgi:Methyltransferase domain